jgi:hypothetical protein
MKPLWNFDEVELDDPDRATHLRSCPAWPELIRQTCHALRVAVAAGNSRFGFDESSRDSRDLRAVVQFPVGRPLFDWFFNGQSGYRAQFRLGCKNGLDENARLVSGLRVQLSAFAPHEITARRFSHDFNDKGPLTCALDQVLASMDPQLSKVWFCERLIDEAGGLQYLFVSRTGPRLPFVDSEPWSSLYPEDAAGWLDVKGAFVNSGGTYQLKPPQERAAGLEMRGSA